MQDHGSSPPFRLSLIENAEFAQHAKKFDDATWESVSIHFESAKLNLTLTRNREKGDDVIQIRYREVPSELHEVRRTIIAIQRQFVPLNRAAAIERALGPEIAEFYRLREETLRRLEILTNRLVRETHDYRLQLDTDTAKHKRKLTASLEEEYKKRTAVLRDRERELTELRQKLDDRSARHARREQSRALPARGKSPGSNARPLT